MQDYITRKALMREFNLTEYQFRLWSSLPGFPVPVVKPLIGKRPVYIGQQVREWWEANR